MDYAVQAIEVLKNLVHAEANAKGLKKCFFRCFPNPNTNSLRDYQLEHEIRKLIPKGRSVIITNVHLWELA